MTKECFYVINYDINNHEVIPYDIMPYLIRCYKETKTKERPTTKEEFMKFIDKKSMYQWWSRCEYEILISNWPGNENLEKWDIYKQVKMNLPVVADTLIKCVCKNKIRK